MESSETKIPVNLFARYYIVLSLLKKEIDKFQLPIEFWIMYLVWISVHVDVFVKLYFNQMKSVLCSAMKLFRETNLHRNPPILRKK